MQRNDSIAAILSADRQRRRRLRSSDAKPAGSDRAVSHIDVLKAVKQPQSLKGRDHWEKFVFQVETYLALLDSGYPEALEDARIRGSKAVLNFAVFCGRKWPLRTTPKVLFGAVLFCRPNFQIRKQSSRQTWFGKVPFYTDYLYFSEI